MGAQVAREQHPYKPHFYRSHGRWQVLMSRFDGRNNAAAFAWMIARVFGPINYYNQINTLNQHGRSSR